MIKPLPRLLAGATIALSSSAFAANDAVPPNAEPGECFARISVPVANASPRIEKEKVLSREETVKYAVKDAVLKTEDVRYITRAGHEKLLVTNSEGKRLSFGEDIKWRENDDGSMEIYPIATRTVTEKVLVQEAYTRHEIIPGQYKTVREKILLEPASAVWKIQRPGEIYGVIKDGEGIPRTRYDEQSGQVMCLVEIPAKYKSFSKRVEVVAPSVKEIEVPAKYAMVTRQEPIEINVQRVAVEPRYGSYKVQRLASDSSIQQTDIEAKYQTVEVAVAAEREITWAQVICEANLKDSKIREIQIALKNKGFSVGETDGRFGNNTDTAIREYQEKHNLGTGGVTYEFLNHVGVKDDS